MPSVQEMPSFHQAPLTPPFTPNAANPYAASSKTRPASLSPFRGKSRRALSLPEPADAGAGLEAQDAQNGRSVVRYASASHKPSCEKNCGKCGKQRIAALDQLHLDGARNFPVDSFRVATPHACGANCTRCERHGGFLLAVAAGNGMQQPSNSRLATVPIAHARSVSESRLGLGITLRPLSIRHPSSPSPSRVKSCHKCGKPKKSALRGDNDVHWPLSTGPLNSNPSALAMSASAMTSLPNRRSSARHVPRKPLAITSSPPKAGLPTSLHPSPSDEASTSRLMHMINNAISETTTPLATPPPSKPLSSTRHHRLSAIDSVAESNQDLEMQPIPFTTTDHPNAPQITLATASPISISSHISYELPAPDLGDAFTSLLPQHYTPVTGEEEGEDYSYLAAESYSHDMGLALPIDGMVTRFKSLRSAAGGSLRRNASIATSTGGGGLSRFKSLKGMGLGRAYSQLRTERKESVPTRHAEWLTGEEYGKLKGGL